MDYVTAEKRLSDIEKHEFDNVYSRLPRKVSDYVIIFLIGIFAGTILFFVSDFISINFQPRIDEVTLTRAVNFNYENDFLTSKTFEFNIQSFAKDDDYSAKSIVVYNLDANREVYSKNADQKTYIASLTKMATTKIIFDEYSLNDVRSITTESAKYGGSSLDLKPGQIFTIRDLLKSAVIASNNQSTYAFQDPTLTVTQMNNYAKALKLDNTNFANPAGFDDDKNYSTAHEIVPIARMFFANSMLLDFSNTPKSEITDLSKGSKIKVFTTDDLVKLGNENVIGGKTGTTQLAGQNLVLLIEKNQKRYLIVILNSADRYQDAYKVLGRL